MGAEWKQQWEVTVTSTRALRQQFSIHGDLLEQVEVFKYLECLLVQDDDEIQAICNQLRNAQATCARARQVFRAESVSPRVMMKIYKVVVQAVLLYSS